MLLLYPVPSVWIGVVEVSLRWWFPDEPDGFFSVFTDLCNDVKYIFIFVIGYGITAADDQGMREVLRRGRWFYLCLGNNKTNNYGSFNTILLGILMNLVHSVSFFWQKDIVWVRALRYSLRGCSEWGLILGLYSVTRWSPISTSTDYLLITYSYHLQAAGDRAPARAGEAERAGHALLPHPPADPGANSRSLLLGPIPQ